MALLGIPWAIGAWQVGEVSGNPETPAETARAIAYQALAGAEGPAAPGDMAVRALDVPAASVLVRKGTVGSLNRFPGGAGQAYLSINDADEIVPVPDTTGAGGRTDLVALVVEDPTYPDQPLPPDGTLGPYERFVVYEGVDANTRHLSQVDAGQSGYALARITRGAGQSTVQPGDITDLRKLANPKTRQETKLLNIGNQADVANTNAAYERFPQQAGWDIDVPSWAVRVHLELYVSGVRVKNDGDAAGDWKGKGRVKLGSVVSQDVELNPTPPDANRTDTFTYIAAIDAAVPAAMRGGTSTLEAQARRDVSSSGVSVNQGWGTTVVAKATFYEDASTDAFTVD